MQVQKRLHDRKRGVGFDDAQMSMVEALSLQATNSVEFSDSDGESLHSASSLHKELLQQQSWRECDLREEDDPEDEDEEGPLMDDEIADEEGECIITSDSIDSIDNEVDHAEMRDRFGTPNDGHRPRKGMRRESRSDSSASGPYAMRKSTASFLSYCQGRRETRMLLNGLYGADSSHASGSLSGSLATLDMSGAAMLPSTMATLSSDSYSDTDSSVVLSAREADNLSGPLSPGQSHASSGGSQPQQSGGGKVLVFSTVAQQEQDSSKLSPYGGKAGDKARFSQFLASGRRLGSFAKDFLKSHELQSGLSIDSFTGGNKSVHKMINSPTVIERSMQMLKAQKTSSRAVDLKAASFRVGDAAQSSKLSSVPELSTETRPGGGAGELSLMGKSMYVPPALSPKSRASSSYHLLLTPQPSTRSLVPASGLASRAASQQALLSSKSSKKVSPGGAGSKTSTAFTLGTWTDDAAALTGEDGAEVSQSADPARSHASSFASVDSAVSMIEKKGVASVVSGAPSRTPSGFSSMVSSPTGRSEAGFSSRVASSSRTAAGALEIESGEVQEQAEFGQVVEDGTSRYFNLQSTQVNSLPIPDYSKSLPATQNTGSRAVLRNHAKHSSGEEHQRTVDKGAFLVVHSQAPPVETVKVVHKPRARNASPPSRIPAGRLSVDTLQASQKGLYHQASVNTRSSMGDVAIPDLDLEPAAPMPQFVTRGAALDALLAPQQQHAPRSNINLSRSLNSLQTSVSLVNFPSSQQHAPPRAASSAGPSKQPALSRSNSNLSFADSDASYDSHEHMRQLHHAAAVSHLSEGQDRDKLMNMPTMHRRFKLDANSSTETIFSDNLTSPPMSRQQYSREPKQDHHPNKISPAIVLDPAVSPIGRTRPGNRHRSPKGMPGLGDLHAESELDRSVLSSSGASRVKRGTNLAIVQPHHVPARPEFATFPQSMYYNVVKNALETRPQPNYNPVWDHSRASKAVRLSSLRRPKTDMSLSLTTAPIPLAKARRIEDAIRNTEHQRRLLVGAIPLERLSSPTTDLRRSPLRLNITRAEEEGATHLGSALENVNFSQSIAAAGKSISRNGSYGTDAGSCRSTSPEVVPSYSEGVPRSMSSKRSLPAPDALRQSIHHADDAASAQREDEGGAAVDLDGSSVSSYSYTGSFTGSQQAGSVGRLTGSVAATPHLLIKPVISGINLSAHPGSSCSSLADTGAGGSGSNSSSPDKEHSPSKRAFVDSKGRLQLPEMRELGGRKDLFEIHRNIDTAKASGVPLAVLTEQASHIVDNTALLNPIKHPYLTMNGTKHHLPDKLIASVVSVHKFQQQFDPNASQTESVFLGNTSQVLIRDSTLGHTTEVLHHVPWLPGGSLDPPAHDRSNDVLGMREKLDLQRHVPLAGRSRGVITIRSQNAIREAFEAYVARRLQNPNARSHSLQFNQLPVHQQQLLLRQFQQQLDQQQSVPVQQQHLQEKSTLSLDMSDTDTAPTSAQSSPSRPSTMLSIPE